MVELFQDGDLVRIVELPDWIAEEAPGLLGSEAVVLGYSGPNEEGTGWEVSLSVDDSASPTGLRVWVLEERQIAATGWRVDHLGHRSTIGLRTPQVSSDEVHLRLATLLTTDEEAMAFERDVRTSLSAFVAEDRIATAIARRREPEFEIELYAALPADGGAIELYNRILALAGTGWDDCDDDGWRRDREWQSAAASGATFIHPAVYYAEIGARPWSSPTRRLRP